MTRRRAVGSNPTLSAMSSRTAYRSRRLFYEKSSLTHSVAPPFHKRSRSARLLGCKRPRNGSLSLANLLRVTRVQSSPIKTQKNLFHSSLPRRSKVRIASFFSPCDPLRWARVGPRSTTPIRGLSISIYCFFTFHSFQCVSFW